LRYNPTHNTQLSFGLVAEVAEPDSGFSNRENDIDYGYAELPLSLQQDAGRTNLNGIFMRVIRDTRDDVDYPRSGSLNIVRVRFNSTELGSDREYAKGIVDLRKHFGVGERSAISTRLHGGVTGQAAPYYDRFYIGGIYSIRGFAEWSLSPAGGDEAFWTGSAEFRFPLTFSGTGQPRVTGLLFADVGQGFVSTPGQSRLSSSLDEVQAGVGYGVRIKIPWLGTLGVDGAVPLTPGRTGDPYRIHLSLGFSF